MRFDPTAINLCRSLRNCVATLSPTFAPQEGNRFRPACGVWSEGSSNSAAAPPVRDRSRGKPPQKSLLTCCWFQSIIYHRVEWATQRGAVKIKDIRGPAKI